MKTSTVIYNGNLRTTAVHLKSGKEIITDAPPDNNGRGEAFSPTDLLATSLASCMLTIMGIVAERNSIDMLDTKVDVTKIMGTNPRRVIEVIIEVGMPKKNYTDKEKSLLENAAKTCPVAISLNAEIKQTISFKY